MRVRHIIATLMAALLLPIPLGAALGEATVEHPAREGAPRCEVSVLAGPQAEVTPSVGDGDTGQRNAVTPTGTVAAALAEGPGVFEAADVPAADGAPSASPCPDGMVHVSGDYCTEVRHVCRRWLDDPKLQYARCGEYEHVARCVGKRIPMSFCMDRYEYTAPGESLPANFQSFVTGSKICRNLGKRLCTESEWNFACEGEEMLPYPYGWSREPKCNQDREDLHEMAVGKNGRKQVLRDLRAPADAHPECVSPFGISNLVGNLDEPVLREIAKYNPPFRNGLKGGWWMAGRNRCRPATTAHDDYYRDIQVGVRCCKDLPGGLAAAG